ncbi:TauD/TfdA family dioxygenase [Actinosynnema sp. CA-248983]
MTAEVVVRQGEPPLLRADGTAEWLVGHEDAVRAAVAEHGAVLVRGLRLRDLEDVRRAGATLVERPVRERQGFAAREWLGDGLHSSALWPATEVMCMHHELSYLAAPPRTLLMACLAPPGAGGGTGVADAAEVLDALPDDLVARFTEHGWLLERNYQPEFGLSWREAFGTDDREAHAPSGDRA